MRRKLLLCALVLSVFVPKTGVVVRRLAAYKFWCPFVAKQSCVGNVRVKQMNSSIFDKTVKINSYFFVPDLVPSDLRGRVFLAKAVNNSDFSKIFFFGYLIWEVSCSFLVISVSIASNVGLSEVC